MELFFTSCGAVLAGALSFLSPCVLPLVPPYLCFISGQSLEEMTADTSAGQDRRVMTTALAFVLGFSAVFIFLGAGASTVGALLRQYLPVLAQVAGAFIILMGLHFLGVFKLGFLMRDTRYRQSAKPVGLLGAFAVGLAFAFGWTPCIGPVLATIFSVAAAEESVTRGMVLLAFYSLGLGVPFLLSALSVSRFLVFFKTFRTHLRTVEKVMGAALVATGVMFMTGSLQFLSIKLLEWFPGLASIG
jgi:cytochrome c-type biogenesis protein